MNTKDEYYHTRWSEPILRRRRAKLFKFTTDEDDITSARQSFSSSPLINPRRSPSGHFASSRRRTCRCYDEKSHHAEETKGTRGTRGKTRRIRESLELQLIGTQVEEALAGDRQSALIKHLDLATDTLEALMHQIDSLEFSLRAAYRVFHYSHQLVIPYDRPSSFHDRLHDEIQRAEALRDDRSTRLRSIMDICTKDLTASERLQSIIDENRSRREDFSIAAKNLKNLLDNSRLSVSQMEKLHRQYEGILMDYRESRRALDAELPKIVRTRLRAISHSFRLVAEFYSDLEYSRQTANFFKFIGEHMCHEEPVMDRVTFEDVPPEMCQKCKVNRVDKE